MPQSSGSGVLQSPGSDATTQPAGGTAISFAQSHLEQPGVIPPVVPREIYDDAQSTKRMASHLKATLVKRATISADMKEKVTKLRQFIAQETEGVVEEADQMDSTDTRLISRIPREIGIPGLRGIDGTAGKPGFAGAVGATGSVGDQGRPGRRGTTGHSGEEGPVGLSGPAGPTGEPGPPPGAQVDAPPTVPTRCPRHAERGS
jgi:hypothetical protein